jgi:hypothetical protein
MTKEEFLQKLQEGASFEDLKAEAMKSYELELESLKTQTTCHQKAEMMLDFMLGEYLPTFYPELMEDPHFDKYKDKAKSMLVDLVEVLDAVLLNDPISLNIKTKNTPLSSWLECFNSIWKYPF